MNASIVTLFVVGIAAGAAAIAISPSQTRPPKSKCAVTADCVAKHQCAVLNRERVCVPDIPPPPALAVVRATSLGRHAAAADMVWLQVLQSVGDAAAQAANYNGLAPWLLLATDLNPDFDSVYTYAGALLPTSRSSADEAERILARGEETLGEDWQKAMWRGFVAYYGRQNPKAAADHFERSVRIGGPPYLADRAKTLRSEAKNCRNLQRNLVQMRREVQQGGEKGLLNDDQVQKILIGCIESKLEADIATFRINAGKSPTTFDELIDAGMLDAIPPAPPGQCWFLDTFKAFVAPCVGGKRSDLDNTAEKRSQ